MSPEDVPNPPVWGGAQSPVQAESSIGESSLAEQGQAELSSATTAHTADFDLTATPALPDQPADPVWTGLDVFRLMIMAILAIIVSGLAMLTVVHGATFKARVLRLSSLPELLIVAQMVAYILLLGYMYVLVTKERRSPRFWKALHWNWPANVWPYLFVGFAMQIVFVFLERFLPFPKQTPFDDLLQRHAAIILIAVFAVTLGPLMEELFFRGFLYPVLTRLAAWLFIDIEKWLRDVGSSSISGSNSSANEVFKFGDVGEHTSAPRIEILARRFGIAAGIFVSAVGFGLLHASQYGYSWASVLLIFLVGMVLGIVRARKDSVAAGFLVHVAYNGTIALAMFAATDGFRHLEKLSQ